MKKIVGLLVASFIGVLPSWGEYVYYHGEMMYPSCEIDGIVYRVNDLNNTAGVPGAYTRFRIGEEYVYLSGDVIIPETIKYDNIETERRDEKEYTIVSVGGYGSRLTSLVLPNTVRNIASISLMGSSIRTINLPDSLMAINQSGFRYCRLLEEIIIPDKVTRIDDYAFASCSQLAHVHIGKSVATIGENVFEETPALTSITVDADNPYFSDVDGVLYNKDKTQLIHYPTGKVSGIEESTAEVITLYPNPVKDMLYVKGAQEGDVIMLYNLAGEVVATVVAMASETAIATADLPAGIYICRIAGRTIKVVKQ